MGMPPLSPKEREIKHMERLRAKIWHKFSNLCSEYVKTCDHDAHKMGACLLYSLAPLLVIDHVARTPEEVAKFIDPWDRFESSCRRIRRKMKTAIQAGTLPVRHLYCGALAGNDSTILAWCSADDSNVSFDQTHPPIEYVVRKDELGPFLKLLGLDAPPELMTPAQIADSEAKREAEIKKRTDDGLRNLSRTWPAQEEVKTKYGSARVYWRVVMGRHIPHIEQIRKNGGGARQVIAFMKALGDPRIRDKETPPRDSPDVLCWIGDDGSPQQVSKATIQNLISPQMWEKFKRGCGNN